MAQEALLVVIPSEPEAGLWFISEGSVVAAELRCLPVLLKIHSGHYFFSARSFSPHPLQCIYAGLSPF